MERASPQTALIKMCPVYVDEATDYRIVLPSLSEREMRGKQQAFRSIQAAELSVKTGKTIL
jgi:hypothetical protein